MERKDVEIITSESVNIGHPDKTCDYIADLFLDEALRQDPNSQMAVECAIKENLLMIYGEKTSKGKINYKKIARQALREVGYNKKFKIIKKISNQSPQINKAVGKKKPKANDQGIVFGYATDEGKNYLPLPIDMANKIMQSYEVFRKKNKEKYFSDAKVQISIKYVNKKPLSIETLLISVSHKKGLLPKDIKDEIRKHVILPSIREYKTYLDKLAIKNLLINPSGEFSIWGSYSDSGCVGRKIVADNYGGSYKVGGGCFSSKNATKIDRSAAYYARYVAKNLVANKLAKKVGIEVSYAIGKEKPLSLNIEASGLSKNITVLKLEEIVNKNFDFSVANIIKELDLLKPIYSKTSVYGHFGKKNLPWERIKKLSK